MVNAGAPLTPLVYAVTGEQVESARFLLDQGADIGVLRVEMIAPALLDGNTKLVSLLLERGFNVNARQQAREAPVGNDAPIDTTSTEVPVAKQDMRLRAELLKSEMDRLLHDKIQASNNIAGKQATLNGMTPLMWATMDTHTGKMADHLTTVRCLLTCKPDVNATDREGRTALDYALAGDPGADNQGICLLARLLIAHGANVHTTNHNGVTTVMYAARAGHLDAIKLLLAAGVDINAQDIKGMTVLMGTMVTNSLGYDEVHIDYHPIVALLLAHGANIQILPGVVAYCKREDIELLIRRGADVNGRDRHGNTALHNAAVFGKSDNVRALLEHGADPNRTNNQGTTALLRAAGSFLFTPEIVTMLLRRGANPKARDNQGKTALHYAVLGNRSDVMKQLLDLGLDPNSTDQHGDTPLLTMLKGYRPNLRLVKILLDHYANVNVPDQAGTRPLQIAIAKGYLDIVEKLKQAGAR
jgi:ankyrin repeat protein